MRGDAVRLAAGLVLLATAAGTAAAAATDGNPAESAVPAGIAAATAGLLSGFFLAISTPPSGREPGEAARGSLAAASLASLSSLFFRFFAVPYPLPPSTRLAWFFPVAAAACFTLRVPAEAPDAPAGGTPRVRALRRHAPDFAAFLSLVPFAADFAVRGSSLLSLVGLSLVLGVWFSRLSRPAVPLFLSSAAFSLLLPDAAFFAVGLLAAFFAVSFRGSGRVAEVRA